MFFKEFQERLYPDLQNILINEVLNFRQGVKTVRQYHSNFVNLLKEIKADEKHYLAHFVNNLADPEIRDAMEKRQTPIHMDSMSSIAEHASRIEETKSRKQKMNRKTLPTANVSTASSCNNNNNNNNNADDDDDDDDDNNNNINNNNNELTLPDHLEDQKNRALQKFRNYELRCCIACFCRHHAVGDLDMCEIKVCRFCNTPMLDHRVGHLSALCDEAPSTKQEFFAAVKNLQRESK